MRHIKENDFKAIKGNIFWRHTPAQAAAKYDVSVKTVLQIRGSHDYQQYKEQVKAQHLPVKNSLRDEILSLHRRMFNKKDNKYIEPRSAMMAIREIKSIML